MSEVRRMVDQLHRSYHEKAWHGASVKETLADVTAKQAAARPLPGAHSIRELVPHMAAWKRYVRETIAGAELDVTDEINFPPVGDTSEAAWQAALDHLDDEHEKLVQVVEGLREDQLDTPVTRHGTTAYVLIHGVIQHDLWHAGQIRMLAKHG